MQNNSNQSADDLVFLEGMNPENARQPAAYSTDRVATELNIKRNSNLIFPHHRVKNLNKVRAFQLGKGKLVITPAVGEKAPTTTSLRLLIAFLYLAHIKRCTTNIIPFSSRELSHVLHRSMNGDFAQQVYRELRSLKMTTLEWHESFETGNGCITTIKNFSLVSGFDYLKRREKLGKNIQFQASYNVEINRHIWANFQDGKISFTNLEALLSFKSGLSEVFYLRVDTILCMDEYASKPLELRSETVIKALQLDDVDEYRKYVSSRKRVISKVAKECNGKILSNGNTIHTKIKPTADKKDWKIVCVQASAKVCHVPRLLPPPVNTDTDYIEYLASLITEATGQPEHQRYHLLLTRYYEEKYIREALSLLKQEPPENMRDKGAVFTTKLKAIIQRAGRPWIKPEDTATP
jgi:hypothetical protein